jgi:MoaA/NifB/PqqE/SkfB family radical SAM enzyme
MRFDQRKALALAFGRSLIAYRIDGNPTLVSASFAVTNRCNLRCSYCNTPFLDPAELPLSSVDLLLERLHSVGVRRLGLAGGEPLVRKDIGDIVAMAKGRGFYVTMNTNLSLYPSRRSALRDVDLFFTSLDGGQAAHESARGNGSYEGVVESIREIAAGGRPVVAICVVTRDNLDAVDALLGEAERGGFRVHFQPQCTDTEIVRGELAPELTTERLQCFFRTVLEHKLRRRPVASSRPYLEALSAWDDFRRVALFDPAIRCAASRGFLYVDPRGMAYPCAFTKGKVAPVDLLGSDWRAAVGRDTPCTRCAVGPYLEFNLLYQRPLRTALSLARSYL